MDSTERYVALGDSFTEGVGDDDQSAPNGVRGWADRFALALSASRPGLGYANLAIRGKKMGQILAEQVDVALTFEPTLISIYAGINDLMRPRVDIDFIVSEYAQALAKLASSGAQLLVFTGFDPRASKLFGAVMRSRVALYNELVREAIDEVGATKIDYWRFREFDDVRMWAQDRIHMSTPGHMRMAQRVLHAVGEPSDLTTLTLPELISKPWQQRAREQAKWTKEFAGPWVGRRLRGTSSGDSLSPRWPELIAPSELRIDEGVNSLAR